MIAGSCLLSCSGEGDRYALGEIFIAQRVGWIHIEPIIKVECSGCHADPPQVGAPQPLTNYEQVIPWISRIRVRVLEKKDMPPGGLRGEGSHNLLAAWIDQGAPYTWESIAGDIAGDIADPPPTWNEDIFNLFEVYCNTCHAQPPTGGAPFPLKTYGQSADLLERFRVRVLERRDMPPGGITDPTHLAMIRRWIEAEGPE